eukprot:Partr_v1_DN26071_c0_g1_i1_m479 putative tRNA A64-2'-O-ribosylphosphate transferase
MKNQQRPPIRDHLLSIAADSQFVQDFHAALDKCFPLVPNRRSGVWYCPNGTSTSVYFKSTDGHYGQWDFNLRRMNIHLLEVISLHGGCVIVDVTKKGKRYPDSLSKTIPIWCAVINRALFPDIHTQLHLPLHIPQTERAQIESSLDLFVHRLMDSGLKADIQSRCNITKPLRPLWFNPDSAPISHKMLSHWQSSACDYSPVICLSASAVDEDKRVVNLSCLGADGQVEYRHVQGAADDAEWWSGGCPASLIVDNMDHLLQLSSDIEICRALTKLSSVSMPAHGVLKRESGDGISEIADTGLFIGTWKSCTKSDVYLKYQLVINCTMEHLPFIVDRLSNSNETAAMGKGYLCINISPTCRYLHLQIPEGKRGQVQLGSLLRVALQYYVVGQPTLIHCRLGIDRSVGVALAILTAHHWRNWGRDGCDKDC